MKALIDLTRHISVEMRRVHESSEVLKNVNVCHAAHATSYHVIALDRWRREEASIHSWTDYGCSITERDGCSGATGRRAAAALAQATSKPQNIWNLEEREAADVVRAWVDAWATKDPQRVAEFMADNCVFRGDPSQPLQTGREAFVTEISRFIGAFETMKIDQLFGTGTEWETTVLIKRTDKMGPNAGNGLAGRVVPVAPFFRAKNSRITEWLAVPVVPLPGTPTAAPRGN